jgi:hypothetical protein
LNKKSLTHEIFNGKPKLWNRTKLTSERKRTNYRGIYETEDSIRTQWSDSIEIQLAMHTPLVALVWLHYPPLKFHGVQHMRMYAAYLDGCFLIASSHKIGNVP